MDASDPRLLEVLPGIDPLSILTPELCNQLQQHAMAAYPSECLGYIRNNEYFRLANLATEPGREAEPDPAIMAGLLADGIDMLCHSHPNGPDCPSGADIRSQMALDVPFAVVSTNGQACLAPFCWGEGLVRPPLLGRPFRHGIEDCVGLIFDFYRHVLGIDLPNVPRDWSWWDAPEGEGMYEENFRRWGFAEVEDELQLGDVILLKAGAKVPNHAGIYLGNHLLLHHLAGRLEADRTRISTIEPMIRWRQNQRLGKVVRYKSGG